MKTKHWILWTLTLLPVLCPADEPATSPDAEGYVKTVQPFFASRCYGCHGSRLQSGGLNLEVYKSAETLAKDAGEMETVLRRLRAGEMPPRGAPRPPEDEIRVVTAWIENELNRQEQLSSLGAPKVLARRLNRAEYNNTVRDLLGIDIQPADDFPPDDSAHGFDNIAQALSVSPSLMEKYLASAERVARTAVFGADVKNLTFTYQQALPRRMETTNLVLIKQPAYYTPMDYDVTGLSHPGSFHLTHRFPADGEYTIRMAGAGYRPKGSEPGELEVWFDGKVIQRLEVALDIPATGFEYRSDYWEFNLKTTAGTHELVAAFPRQYEGLPPVYGGPNPSKRPIPPTRDEPNLQALIASMERETIPERRERRKLEIDRAIQQASLPVTLRKETAFPGMSMTQIEVIGPLESTQAPSPASQQKLYTCGHLNGTHVLGCERKILSGLARRAYRRSVTEADVNRLVELFASARNRGSSFEEALTVAITAILVSPDFLFRIENAADTRDAARQFELASRLSYFLWSSLPDEDLLEAAEQGRLNQPAIITAQVRRMLQDPKSSAFVENFAGQWLETRRLKTVQPDRERYPDFDDYLRASMIQETELFFKYVVQEDRSILDLINGEYTFLNERLARHYGIRDVNGTEFRKVDLKGTGRGGLLTQASVLTVSSYGNRTSPVLRGKWILENILNSPPPPPPPNVPSLDEDAVGTSASLREQLEQHRRSATCASCHSRMDPLGFGLENYDAVGGWRTRDGNFEIDPSGELPDGRRFKGAEGLKQVLAQDREAFAECLTEKLMMYALGRSIERSDEAVIREIVARAAGDNYRFSSILLGVVNSPAFSGQRTTATQIAGRK